MDRPGLSKRPLSTTAGFKKRLCGCLARAALATLAAMDALAVDALTSVEVGGEMGGEAAEAVTAEAEGGALEVQAAAKAVKVAKVLERALDRFADGMALVENEGVKGGEG